MQMPNSDMLVAFGRHVVSYSAGAITVAVGFHVLSADQGHALGTAINQVVSGLQTAVGGMATIASIAAALYAAWSSSPKSMAKSIVTAVPGTTVITSPDIADTTPDHPQIVSNVTIQPTAKP